MSVWVFSFITGCISTLGLPHLPALPLILLLLLVAGVIGFFTLTQARISLYWQSLSGLLIGVAWMASVGHWACFWQHSLAQNAQVQVARGKVSEVRVKAQVQKFRLELQALGQREFSLYQPSVQLNWYRSPVVLRDGQVIRVKVKLKPLNGLMNQGGFDYHKWLVANHISAQGYVVKSAGNQLLSDQPSYRQRLMRYLKYLPLEHRSWLAALTIGDRRGLTPQNWQLVQRTGVSHLIAISGLHLGMVAVFSYGLWRLFFPAVGLVIRVCYGQMVKMAPGVGHINFHRSALVFSLLNCLIYSLLAGLSIPTVRAWLMMNVMVVMTLIHQHWSGSKILLFSAGLLMICLPLSPLSISSWLSFSAVGWLLWCGWQWRGDPREKGVLPRLAGLFRLQCRLSLLMMPITAMIFAQVSVISPLVNIVLVPLVTLFLLPVCLLAIVFIPFQSVWFLNLLTWVGAGVERGLTALRWVTEVLPWGMTVFPIPFWCWLLVCLFTVISFLPLRRKYQSVAGVLLLPALSFYLPSYPPGWR